MRLANTNQASQKQKCKNIIKQKNKQANKQINEQINSIYPLPCDVTLSAYINGNHDHVSRYKCYYQKINWVEKARKFSFGSMPDPNITGLAIVLNKTFPLLTGK